VEDLEAQVDELLLPAAPLGHDEEDVDGVHGLDRLDGDLRGVAGADPNDRQPRGHEPTRSRALE
jgi:hypothetical protein